MKLLAALFAAILVAMPMTIGGCASTRPNSGNTDVVSVARQKLEELPEPTFESLEVYTHDLSATGTALLVAKYPDAKVPVRIFAESALSILEKETITQVDLVALSNSLDSIKNGQVKAYLGIAWMLLELNGVIRRDEITAPLTQREQRLVIALMKGIELGTGATDTMNKVLNGYGPRYGPAKTAPAK